MRGRSSTPARALRAAAVPLVLVVAGAGVAGATPSVGSVSAVLARGLVAEDTKVDAGGIKLKTKQPFEIVTQTVTIRPGGTSGWHSHPGPVFVAVKTGAVTVYDATCTPRRYAAGQGFVEGTEPAVVRNEGETVSESYATLLVPTGSPARLDAASLCPGIV